LPTVFDIGAIDETGSEIGGGDLTFTSAAAMAAAQVPWAAPVIFDRVQIQIVATAAANLRMGDFLIEYEEEAYTVTPT